MFSGRSFYKVGNTIDIAKCSYKLSFEINNQFKIYFLEIQFLDTVKIYQRVEIYKPEYKFYYNKTHELFICDFNNIESLYFYNSDDIRDESILLVINIRNTGIGTPYLFEISNDEIVLK